MDPPASPPAPGLAPGGAVLLAHGAGGHKDHPHLLDLAALLAGLGLAVARFDFPYRSKGAGAKKAPPDPMPRLVATVEAVAAAVREHLAPRFLILSGHSMGGRACSLAAAAGLPADGLLLFSYPWHPPGKPDRPRGEHLPRLALPVLCFTGTRDPFCEREKIAGVFRTLPPGWTQVFLEGADHGLATLKRSGRSREGIFAEVRERTGEWIGGHVLPARQSGNRHSGKAGS